MSGMRLPVTEGRDGLPRLRMSLYQDPDWIDCPVWTPEKLAEAERKAELRRQIEELNRTTDYKWFLSYGGTD